MSAAGSEAGAATSAEAYNLGYRAGFLDGRESLVFNPDYPLLDEDGDGLYDNWEVVHGLDPTDPNDANSDPDSDLLDASQEFFVGTAEGNPDTDGDGIPDGAEFAVGLNPLEPSDAQQDMDGDGFSNLEEYLANTDPSDPADAPATSDSEPVTAASQVYGFIGQYFEGTDFDRFVLSRQDANIDFSWASGPPMAELPDDNFSIRWSGMFTAPHTSGTEEYQFTTLTNDGVRLYLSGNLVINEWKDQVATPYSHTVTLGAQETIPVTMEYYEGLRTTRAQLSITRLASGEEVSTSQTVTVPDPAEPSNQDTDGDGIPDTWEFTYGLNAWADDANDASNSDGVSNLEAYQSDLDPWTLEPTDESAQTAPETDSGESTTSGTVVLTWTAPSTRADGESISLSEIDGYVAHYGQDSSELSQQVEASSGDTQYTFERLESGVWYFSVQAVDGGGRESEHSNVLEYTVP